MLGLLRLHHRRLPSARDHPARMHGHAAPEHPEEEHDQLPFVEDVSADCWAEEEEVSYSQKDVYEGTAEGGLVRVRRCVKQHDGAWRVALRCIAI
jgi:hypothetical protein